MYDDKIKKDIEKVLRPLKFQNARVVGERDNGIDLQIDLDMDLLNYKGALHGGMIYTLCDICAGITLLKRGTKVSTLQAGVNYIKEGLVGPFTAKSKILHKGHTTSVINIDVEDGRGELIANGNFTMFILNNY